MLPIKPSVLHDAVALPQRALMVRAWYWCGTLQGVRMQATPCRLHLAGYTLQATPCRLHLAASLAGYRSMHGPCMLHRGTDVGYMYYTE
jgi:hypothetical protein